MATEVAQPTGEAETIQTIGSRLDHRVPITVEFYEKLARSGMLPTTPHLYLWKGQLVKAMTKGRPHAIAVLSASRRLTDIIPDGWHVETEQPLILSDDSVPEPDVTIIRGAIRDYPTTPRASDLSLLVEVADSSLAEDRGDALRAYAAAQIPVYWIVSLPDRRVEVYTEPARDSEKSYYRMTAIYPAGDEVPVLVDGRELGRVAVNDILP